MNTQPTAAQTSKIKWAKVADYTGYDSTQGMNAGKYGYWEEYEYVGEGQYRHTYHTTAQGFSFCKYCGNFQDGCCDRPEMVGESEVLDAIKSAEQSESDDVWAKYELFDVKEWIEKLRRRTRDLLNKTDNEHAIISCAVALDVKLD